MSSFADKSFEERLLTMGDIAQTAFEKYATENDVRFAKYGFDRPPFTRFWRLPTFVRATPDYVCEAKTHFFVEVKGARGRYLKIKHESMDALEPWNAYMTVWFFVFRDDIQSYHIISYRNLLDVCEQSPTKLFIQDKKPYYEIKTKTFDWKGISDER